MQESHYERATMREPLEVANQIEKKIVLLEKGRSQLNAAASQKAITIAQYHCKRAVVIMKLKAGKPMELEGETIENPPATLTREIADGICWQERQAMELAEAEYKALVEKLHSVQAELNGWQSINRFLEVK